jgi:N-acyl-D-amino-acid deacylase
MNRILFKNFIIIDGTGNPGFRGSVFIERGFIKGIIKDGKEISKVESLAQRVVDGEGRLLLTPGFIDMHSHSDLAPFSEASSLLYKNCSRGKISQGVTTEVCGQDGYSAAPIVNKTDEFYTLWSGLTGLKNCSSYNTKSVNDYLRATGETKYPVKIATLTGHNNLRVAVNGFDSNRLDTTQIKEMKKLLETSFKEGSCGLSLGLIYPPGMYGDSNEITELARVVAKYNKIIVAHIRNESDMVMEALNEYGTICLNAGCSMHISHLKVCGEDNFRLGRDILSTINSYKERGVKITYDLYPYDAGSTMLQAIFPPEAHNGGPDKLLKRLSSANERDKIYNRIFNDTKKDWDNFIGFSRGGLRGIVISGAPAGFENLSGKSLYDIGKDSSLDPDTEDGRRKTFDLICKYEVETELTLPMVSFNQQMDNVKLFLNQLDMMSIGTDGISGQHPHPRLYGSFPKVINLLKERKVEEVIHSITGRPGKLLGINIGLIREGFPGDILIIDRDKLQSNSTWKEPRLESTGIEHIFINGKEVKNV